MQNKLCMAHLYNLLVWTSSVLVNFIRFLKGSVIEKKNMIKKKNPLRQNGSNVVHWFGIFQRAELFYPGLQLTGWGPPISWKAICFTQKTTNLNFHLIQKHPHRRIQKNVWLNIWNHDLDKQTHKINHYKVHNASWKAEVQTHRVSFQSWCLSCMYKRRVQSFIRPQLLGDGWCSMW